MDRLKELEEKKRKLQELRQRRKYGGTAAVPNNSDLVNHLLKTIDKDGRERNGERGQMVSIAVQTEATGPQEHSMGSVTGTATTAAAAAAAAAAVQEVITYDKAIQTDEIEDKLPATDLPDSREAVAKEEQEEEEEQEPVPVDTAVETNDTPREVYPAIVRDQDLSLATQTFSLLEALGKNQSLLKEHAAYHNKQYQRSHELPMDMGPPGRPLCVSVDYHNGLVLAVVQTSLGSTESFSTSMVYVYKFATAEVVDAVEFKGQSLLRGEFIRNESSAIVSMVLTSYNGKTVLYELRATTQEGRYRPVVERNIISKNYHNYPVYALCQHGAKGRPVQRIYTASTDGTVRELSSLDLTPFNDGTGNAFFSSLKVVPATTSDLILQDARKRRTVPASFLAHLSKVALYDELAISSLLSLPEDPGVLYLGGEDGGIYKVSLAGISARSRGERTTIKVQLDNNGFLPRENGADDADAEDDSSDTPIFHSAPVTGLCRCDSLPGIVASSSMDWRCVLWDVLNSVQLAAIELDSPVASCEWLAAGDEHFLAMLTAEAFHIYEVALTSVPSSLGPAKWLLGKPPTPILHIPVEDCAEASTLLTAFKLVREGETWFAVLGSDATSLGCYSLSV